MPAREGIRMRRAASDDNWHAQETYRSLMEYGRGMLRFVFLANGGAVLAVLTFLGHLLTKSAPAPNLRSPLVCFLVGLLLGGLGTGTAYLTQLTLYNEYLGDVTGHGLQSHTTWLYCTTALIALSLVAFGCGSLIAITRLQ